MKLIIEGSEDDKVLHRKARRVDKIDDTIRTICGRMEELMLQHNGVGISGNQVGLLKRIIVILDGEQVVHMINPEIVIAPNEWEMGEEGCLSIPQTFIHKKRLKTIKVKYRDRKGKPHIQEYSGLTARVIQHEIDHLDGILMIDENEQEEHIQNLHNH
ncbi:MAG: peptide deformylase [Candidatus Nanopelagicaceae bacterium]